MAKPSVKGKKLGCERKISDGKNISGGGAGTGRYTEGQIFTFSLGSELYGIDIGYVTEIVGLQRINPIPDSPDYNKGVESIPDRLINPIPELSGRRQGSLLKGIGKSGENLRLIIDCEHLFINQETAIQ